jgi:hypothetical protein
MNYKQIDGKRFCIDAKGGLVPEEAIKPLDLLRDQLVSSIQDKVLAMRQKMEDTKADCLNDIEAFMNLSAEQYGVKLGGEKGNVSLTSFDGSARVVLAISESLDLTEGVHAAKQLIDEYLTDLTKDSSSDLRTLVTNAFRVKQGKMDVKRILELRSYNISDERWKKAMDIISESVRVTSSKRCFRVHSKKDDSFQLINLDFATI